MKLNIPEILIALSFIGLGIYVGVTGAQYGMGTAARLGAGGFPLILGVLLALAGLVLLVKQHSTASDAMAVEWRPLIFITGSLVVFAATIQRFGLIPATMGLVIVSAFAERGVNFVVTLLLSVAVAALAVLLFIYGLNLPMQMVLV